jgi:hypothetical protein
MIHLCRRYTGPSPFSKPLTRLLRLLVHNALAQYRIFLQLFMRNPEDPGREFSSDYTSRGVY